MLENSCTDLLPRSSQSAGVGATKPRCVDDRAMFAEVGRSLAMHGIHHHGLEAWRTAEPGARTHRASIRDGVTQGMIGLRRVCAWLAEPPFEPTPADT